MGRIIHRLILAACALAAGLAAGTSRAQEPAKPARVTHVTGLAGVKNKTNGKLGIENGALRFTHDKTDVDLPANSLEDVVTGNDSQRLVHGTLGTLTMLAPYGSGRFLSLFRTKLDTLTIKYRDADGGLHGAIFTMGAGTAESLKVNLLAAGAHTTIPVPPNAASPNGADGKEQKP